ncbi:MAG: radical SAM protein [Oscillospiraceae bacterium]|nr:radical SAM protein [Oscillospiraceae bacterium]
MCSYGHLKGQHMSMPTFYSILDVIKIGGVKSVYLTGGEPALHSDVETIISSLKSEDIQVRLSTNGTIWGNKIHALKNVDTISVSIDGKRDRHDSVRGVKGSFDKAVEFIKSVKSLYPDKSISLSATVLPENVLDMPMLCEWALDNELTIGFQPFVPYFSTLVNRKAVKKDRKIKLGKMIDFFDSLYSECWDNIDNVKQFYGLCKVFLKEEYSNLPMCLAGQEMAVINQDGTILPCNGIKSDLGGGSKSIAEQIKDPTYQILCDMARQKECSKCMFYCYFFN